MYIIFVDGSTDNDNPVSSNTSSVIDPSNENGDSGGADSSLAPAAAVAAVLTLLAVLVIGGIVAALAILRCVCYHVMLLRIFMSSA